MKIKYWVEVKRGRWEGDRNLEKYPRRIKGKNGGTEEWLPWYWGKRRGRKTSQRGYCIRSQGIVLISSCNRRHILGKKNQVSEWSWPCGIIKRNTLRSDSRTFNCWLYYHLPCNFEHESLFAFLVNGAITQILHILWVDRQQKPMCLLYRVNKNISFYLSTCLYSLHSFFLLTFTSCPFLLPSSSPFFPSHKGKKFGISTARNITVNWVFFYKSFPKSYSPNQSHMATEMSHLPFPYISHICIHSLPASSASKWNSRIKRIQLWLTMQLQLPCCLWEQSL